MALKNSGGIWVREGKKGKFLSGVFEPEGKNGPKYKFMAFKNDDKEGKQPDWRIVMADDEEEERRPPQRSASTKTYGRPNSDDFQVSDDDVPF